MNAKTPEWLKHEIEQLNQSRMKILRELNFQDVINKRSTFLRSGEITNARELVFHLLDEEVSEREEPLFETLRQKLKSRIPPNKIGYYVGMLSSEYEEEFNTVLNHFTYEFLKEYSMDGRINWKKLAEL